MRNTLIIASVLLSACAVTAPDEWTPPEETRALLDGKSDGDQTCDFSSEEGLHEAFGYRKTPGGNYRIGLTWNEVLPLDNGNTAELSTYLMPDNRVLVDYSERHHYEEGGVTNLNHAIVVTDAVIAEDRTHIDLGTFAHGVPMDDGGSDCSAGFRISFDHDVVGTGLAGQQAVIHMGISSGFAVDPDHLDQIPSDDAREYFTGAIADGTIKVLRLGSTP